MSRAVPYEPRVLDKPTAEHLDLIASRLCSGEFNLGGGAWRFALTPLSGRAPWPADPIHVAMEWGGGRVHLVAGRDLLWLLYAHRFPAGQVDVLPKNLALAALRLAWHDVIERAQELTGRAVRLTRITRATPSALEGAPFSFALSLDSTLAKDGIQALIAADGAGIALLAMLARRQPPKSRTLNPATSIPLLLEVGEMRLTVAALRAVAVNDVVLPDTVIDPQSPVIWLRADSRRAARARLDTQSLVIESVLQESPSMTGPSLVSANRDTPRPVRLDDLEVRLAFDLGQQTVTLGWLSALQPGAVLALDSPSPRLVAIRANGALIGRGELVRLDDRVGVRVLELAEPDAVAISTDSEAA